MDINVTNKLEPVPEVWCIQVIVGPDRDVLEEKWIHALINPDYKYPKHGAKHESWDRIYPGAKYHLTPFSKLDREEHLTRGKVK